MRNVKLATIIFACILCAAATAHGDPQIANLDSRGREIICFGDSITKGMGSTEGNDYPSVLSRMLGMPVINAGVIANTTRDALERIEDDVLSRDPRMVIVELSINDLLCGISMKEIFDNLDKTVRMIQEKGAIAVLVHIDVDYLEDEYLGVFRKIAEERKALLIPNIMKGILTNPSLMSDEVHPNDEGYRMIAERVYKVIKPFLRR